MFKVSTRKQHPVLTPDWNKTSSRIIVFDGAKIYDDDDTYLYLGLLNAQCNECNEWKNNPDTGRGEYIHVDNINNGCFVRFQKKEITYNNDSGNKVVKPSEWDEFFISLCHESIPADGNVKGTIDITESNLGFASRYKVEADPIKRGMLKEAFFDIKPSDPQTASLRDFSSLDSSDVLSKKSGGKGNYAPRETTQEVLAHRLSFISREISLVTDGEEDTPLFYTLSALPKLEEEKRQAVLLYLDILTKLCN